MKLARLLLVGGAYKGQPFTRLWRWHNLETDALKAILQLFDKALLSMASMENFASRVESRVGRVESRVSVS